MLSKLHSGVCIQLFELVTLLFGDSSRNLPGVSNFSTCIFVCMSVCMCGGGNDAFLFEKKDGKARDMCNIRLLHLK